MSRPSSAAKVRAPEILRALERKTPADCKFFGAVKTGPTVGSGDGLRQFDAVWLRESWYSPQITGFEVKVSRTDLLGDQKWHAYLPLCHRFYFVAPAGLSRAEEIPDPAGLMTYDPVTERLSVRKRTISRPVELDPWMLYYLVMWRVDGDRHPFYTSARAELEAWVTDGNRRRELGRQVATRMTERLRAAEKETERARRAADEAQEQAALWRRLRALLAGHGIFAWLRDADALEELASRLAGPPPPPKIAIGLRQCAAQLVEMAGKIEGGP